MIIAGTGRAGTSFLVRYLSALGLETEIDRSGLAQWDAHAKAGYESMPVVTPAEQLPYVIKCPWLNQFVEQVLAQQDQVIDVVVIPMRDLVESAASRVILEMRTIHEGAKWMADFDETWELWGTTPGGLVYSLNPLDQARILAVGFHRLVHRLTEADIPIVFVEFPRLISDADYLFGKLRSFLPATVTAEVARSAHGKLAHIEDVRTETELSSAASNVVSGAKHSDLEHLDQIAIRRELKRLRAACAEQESALATMRRESDELGAALETEREAHAAAYAMWETMRYERDALLGERGILFGERATLLNELEAVRQVSRSRSWRLTAPLREATNMIRSLMARWLP